MVEDIFKKYRNTIERFAGNFRLPPELIFGIMMTESSGSISAQRFEKNYKWLYKPEEFFQPTSWPLSLEITFQKTSLGLMQVMGPAIVTGKQIGRAHV